MARKDGFLLIELLVALVIFIIFASVFSYFIYISLQTKKLAESRLNNLNSAINNMEKYKYGEKNNYAASCNVKQYNIKISKELGYFRFVIIKKEFSSIMKKNNKLILIG